MSDSPHPAPLILMLLMFGTIAVGCLFFSQHIQAFYIRTTRAPSWEAQFLKHLREGPTSLWSIRFSGVLALLVTLLLGYAIFNGIRH